MSLLAGLMLQQTFVYFPVYTKDGSHLKCMIPYLALLDAGNTIVTMYACYYYVGTNYFDPLALLDGAWSVRVLALLMTGTVPVAQLFYVQRVYLLSSEYRYAAIVAAMCTLGVVGFAAAESDHVLGAQQFHLAADTLLTTSLMIFLRRCNTSSQRTKAMLRVFVVYTVNTGLLTSAFNLLTRVTDATHMNNMLYIAAGIPICTRSYVIAVLTVVNSRHSLTSSARDESDFGTFGLGKSQQNSMLIPARLEHFRATGSEVEVVGISSWKAPTAAEVKHATQNQDGDDVISQEDK